MRDLSNERRHYSHVLATALEKSGKTRAEWAHALGIAATQISQLLRGSRSLKVEELKKTAEYLDMPVMGLVEALIWPVRGFTDLKCPVCRVWANASR